MQTYDHGTFLIVLDCADLARAADFWCPALGYDRPHPPSPGHICSSSPKLAAASNSSSKRCPGPSVRRTGCTSTSARPTSTPKSLVSSTWAPQSSADNRSSNTTGSGTSSPTPTATSSASFNHPSTFPGLSWQVGLLRSCKAIRFIDDDERCRGWGAADHALLLRGERVIR